MDETAKEQLTARFRAYLDSADATIDQDAEGEGESAVATEAERLAGYERDLRLVEWSPLDEHASPMDSVIKASPGPDVAVSAGVPPNDAPMTWFIEASSSSAWTTA